MIHSGKARRAALKLVLLSLIGVILIWAVGALTAALSQVSSGSGELLGMPSPQLRTALAGSPVRIYEPYESL